MALLVPVEHPIAPLCRYDWNSPPYLPAIPLPQQVENMRAPIATCVANEASGKATTSSARMYCFNLFATNNWNNQQFAETVKLVGEYVCLQLSKGAVRDLQTAIPEAANLILTMYVSALIFQVPELKNSVHPNVVQAASQNAPQFENLKREIAQMNNMHPNMGMMPMMNNGYPQQQQMYPQMQQPMYPGMHPQMQQPMYPQHMQQPYYQNPQQQQQQFANVTSGFSGGGGFAPQMNPNGYTAPEDDRYASRVVQQAPPPTPVSNTQLVQQNHPHEVHHTQQSPYYRDQQAPKVETPQAKPQPTELTIEQGTEMDRSKHQLAYFGGLVTQDLRPRMEAFQKSADQLKVAYLEDENSPVKAEWTIAFSLPEAISMGRVEYQKRQETGAKDLYREFVMVATPIPAGKGLVEYWEAIRGGTSFVGVAKKMQHLSVSLQQTKTDNNADEVASSLNFLSAIDVKLTDLVNDFLKINLGLKGVKIDSFVSDIESLGPYLYKNYGALEQQAFTSFEGDIFDVLMYTFSAETKQDILSVFGEGAEDQYPLFPESYSVTHLFLNSKELGYHVTDEPVRINPQNTPALFNVVDSLLSHKKAIEMATVSDLLVCSDGVMFQVYRNCRIQGDYLIAKV